MAYKADFDEFWRLYPVKRDRLDALKAYQKARKNGATHADIIAGLHDYRRHKPEWQAWKHGATWLNKGGWQDEWTAPPAPMQAAAVDWYEECQRVHGGACGLSQYRHHLEMQKAKSA